jgi:hypothetical protein
MTAASTPPARPIRRRGRFGAIVVAGTLLSAGVLAGCADSSDPGAAERSTSPATEVHADPAFPTARTYANPDVNRERAWETAGVLPNDP